MEAAIPNKLFFKIGEIAQITALRPSVLRYWESEFTVLAPKKSRSGQRLYAKKDIEVICEIKRLLYTEKLTIEGARKKIAEGFRSANLKTKDAELPGERLVIILRELTEELKSLRNSL
jgi:DNA-binding transcriptional MerR regulator